MKLVKSATMIITALLLVLTYRADAQLVTKTGEKISMVADQSQITPKYILYTNAHMTTQSGSTLDADQIKAVIGTKSELEDATATGNVKAYVIDKAVDRKYDIRADNAVFDPVANTINLTGNVKAVILSDYTEGPLTQTGTSATVQLGKAPNYPQIVMRQVHTLFSVKQ